MRKETRSQYYRIQHVLEMTRRGSRTARLPNARDLSRDLEVSRRTILRDLDFLRYEMGAPIQYDASRKGYVMSDNSWKLPTTYLKRHEFLAFCLARKLLDAFRGTPLEAEMRSAFAKLAEVVEGTVTFDLKSFSDHLSVLGDDYVQQDPDIWTRMARHVDVRERINITYRRFDGTVKSYTLEPYHLIAYHGNWYVLAKQANRPGPVTFALSRVLRIAGTGRYFDIPASFDVRQHIDQAFGIVRGEKPFKVRLLFARAVATYIRERIWHRGQKIIERKDGSVELRFETRGWKELVRWVLSWQPDVEVLAPKKLRERVNEKMRAALRSS